VRKKVGAGDETRATAPPDLFDGGDWLRVDAALEELSAHAGRRAGDPVDAVAEVADSVARRADAFRDDLATVADGGSRKNVLWVDVRGRSVSVHASPVDVGPMIRSRVLANVRAAVMTSATLTADGRFDYLRGRLGLDDGLTFELAVDPPFDYARQALLYLPRDLPTPDDPAFGAAADARIAELLDIVGGRAFVLTTSWRSLRRTAQALRDAGKYRLLVQGDMPRGALLDAFRAGGSVLVATSSFWEGVDVPGDALSLV